MRKFSITLSSLLLCVQLAAVWYVCGGRGGGDMARESRDGLIRVWTNGESPETRSIRPHVNARCTTSLFSQLYGSSTPKSRQEFWTGAIIPASRQKTRIISCSLIFSSPIVRSPWRRRVHEYRRLALAFGAGVHVNLADLSSALFYNQNRRRQHRATIKMARKRISTFFTTVLSLGVSTQKCGDVSIKDANRYYIGRVPQMQKGLCQ